MPKTHKDLFLESCKQAKAHFQQYYGIDTSNISQEQERRERMFMSRYGMARLYERLEKDAESDQIKDASGIFTQAALLERVSKIEHDVYEEYGFSGPKSTLMLAKADIETVRAYSLWLACKDFAAFVNKSHA